MDLHTYSDTLDADSAARMREHMERVEREEREWATARLHANNHGNWLSPDECSVCLDDRDGIVNPEGDPAFSGAFTKW